MPPQHTHDQSYGIIPVYYGEGADALILVLRHTAGHWGLPKGAPDPNETPLDTAQRELAEETGITDITISEHPRFTQQYSFRRNGVLHHKTVTYFVGYAEDRSVSVQPGEIRDYRWTTIETARGMLIVKGNINEAFEQFVDWWQSRESTTG